MRTVDRHTGITIDLPDDLPAGWRVVDHGEGLEVLRKTSPTTTVEINFTMGASGEETDDEEDDDGPADLGVWFYLITDGGRHIRDHRSEGWDTCPTCSPRSIRRSSGRSGDHHAARPAGQRHRHADRPARRRRPPGQPLLGSRSVGACPAIGDHGKGAEMSLFGPVRRFLICPPDGSPRLRETRAHVRPECWVIDMVPQRTALVVYPPMATRGKREGFPVVPRPALTKTYKQRTHLTAKHERQIADLVADLWPASTVGREDGTVTVVLRAAHTPDAWTEMWAALDMITTRLASRGIERATLAKPSPEPAMHLGFRRKTD